MFVVMIASLKTTVNTSLNIETSSALFAVLLVCVMTPVAWVRNFAKFSFTYILGNILVLVIVVVCSWQSVSQIASQGVSDA